MKQKFHFVIVFFLISWIGKSQTVDQQYAPTLNVSLTNHYRLNTLTTANVGQSFTAGVSEPLTKIGLKISTSIFNFVPGMQQLKLYQGAGITGTLLNTTNFNVVSSTQLYLDLEVILSSPVNMTAGQVYTFDIFGVGTANVSYWGVQHNGGSGAYPGGTMHLYGDGLGADYDLWFQTFYSPNTAPTNLTLSTSSVNENVAVNTNVGSLSSTDANAGNTFTYSLVAGTGDTDNASFNINSNNLRIGISPNFETKSSYSIRLRTTDQGGLFFDKQFTIAINNVNEAVTDIALSASSIAENVPANTAVGTFSSTDIDASNTFTYTLVSGTGSTGNAAFGIFGTVLRFTNIPNFEAQSSYAIRVRSTDQGGLFFEKQFTITVTDRDDTITNLTLSASSINENVVANSTIGTLQGNAATANTYTYSLVSGTGSTDNASFNIVSNNTLRIGIVPNFETKSSYAIRIRTTESGGTFFEKEFTITINNLNETATDISLSASSTNENVAANTVIGTLTSTAATQSAYTYSLVSGTGSTDNASFNISGNSLRIGISPDFETKSSYAIRIRSTEQDGATFEKQFTITILDLGETPATHLNFDGANDFVSIATPFRAFTNAITVEFWMNPTLQMQLGCGMGQGTASTDTMSTNVWLVHGNGNGKFSFYVNDSGTWRSVESGTVTLNAWNFYSCVADASGIKIYKNGVLEATHATGILTGIQTNVNSQLHVGKDVRAATGTGRNFQGNFDDIRIYSSALSLEQINARKSCELIGTESGLRAYYKFNQGFAASSNASITTLNDATSNAFNGTLTNFALIGSTSNWLSGSAVTTGSILPTIPTVTTPLNLYQTIAANALTATSGGSGLLWYTVATGGTGNTTAPTPSTTALGNTSYWVSSTNANGCESNRVEIVVTVNPLVAATHLNFDGSNDHITVPATTFNNLTSGTIETYVFVNGLDNQTISAKQRNGINSYAVLSIGGGSAPNGKVFYQAKSNSSLVSTATLSTGQWYHIAVSFSGSNASLYINGVLDTTVSGDFSLPNDTSVTATSLGAWLGDGGGQYLNGNLDEFRVWNVARTADQINGSKNCELQGSESGLVAYYKFNQGSSAVSNTLITSLTSIPNTFNGTLTNFALSGTISNWMAGSPVTTGSVIPAPPTATSQSFCGISTVAGLIPAPSATIKWYNVATGGSQLSPSTVLSTATYYATAVNANGCESARTNVSVTVNSIPLAPTASSQTFEKYTTTANLVASGTNLKWYNVAINGSALANNAPIYTGSYYVSQTINGCESASRSAVTITVNTATWDGSAWVNTIEPDASKGAVFLGNYAQATNIIAKGVEVIGTSIVTVPSGFDFTANNYIEVASTSSFVFENNANLLQNAAAATTTGNVVFKRNTSMQRLAYTMWSSPVANQNALAFSPLTVTNRFYKYAEPTNTFVEITTPSTTNFVVAKGYGVRAPNTFADAPNPATPFTGTFTGAPNNGDYTFSGSKVADGYNLIGNPYPSTLDVPAFFAANTNVDALYFWDNTSLGLVGNRYATKNAVGAVASALSPLKAPTDFIGIGQGFYVRITSATNTNVVFTNAMRSSENTPVFFRNANTNKSLFKLNLLSATNNFNQIAIGYMNGATNGVDNQIDAVPFGQSATMVSSLINNNDYVIQGRALPFANTDVVPLGFKTNVAGNYSFTSEAFEGVFANNQNIFLKDNLTGTTHNIKQSPYQFASNVGTFNNRFEIVYVNGVLGIENPNFNDNNVFVFVKDNNININSGNVNMKNVQVFDIRGRLVFDKKEVNATQFEIENLKVEQAVLIVKITAENGSVVSKKIVY